MNGNTYQVITEFFDKISGKASFKRSEAAALTFSENELNYSWINTNIIQKQCIMCHAAGTQHDFSNYEGIIAKINTEKPNKSHIYGMLKTNSMPPFPMPTVHEDMKTAFLKWIEKGAPKN